MIDEGKTAIKALIFVEPEHQDSLAAKLKTAVANDARVIVTSPEAVEVVAPGVNKAKSISGQLNPLGYTLNDAVVFGDSGNDVEMLSQAALGVAMENCREEACRAALVIADAHDTDAIADIIERAAMTRECKAREHR